MKIVTSPEIYIPTNNKHMVQYCVWPNCTNRCDFCLLKQRPYFSKKEQIESLQAIRHNIKQIDWQQQFVYGISLLGGELFYVKDEDIVRELMSLVDDIIDVVIKPCYETARFSFVSNALYEPTLLYRVVDRVVEQVGLDKIDANFSYDLKYRYQNVKAQKQVEQNINEFCERYNYCAGVQMIATQYLISMWMQGQFDPRTFIRDMFPKANLCLLYPHPVATGKVLDDFAFKRADFITFVKWLGENHRDVYINFTNSIKNSSTFKYTGLNIQHTDRNEYINQPPMLSDGKELLRDDCHHSMLYTCYTDSSRCMMCDINAIDESL